LGNVRKNRISLKDYIRDTYINSFHRKEIKEDEFVEKEQFIIFVYHEIVQKTKGDTFGELALQHEDSKRTATIITNTDIILGYLTKSDYEACLSEIEIKRRKTEVNFIMSFSIFDKMNWINFENKYFNFFKREYYSQGESIMKQGEKISKIIFIMDGQFEITSSLSILSLYKILRQKTNYSFKKINIRIKKKINNIRLYICNNKDILGLNDSCFFGLQGEQISFITATCISNKSIAFTLDKSILDDLQNKMSEINENLKIVINKREEVMIDRLTSIFNQLIKNKRSDIIDKQTSIIYKNNNRYIYNNSSVLNKNKNNNVFNNNKNREIYSPYKNFILSAKHRETSPISIYMQNKIDTNSRNEMKMIEQSTTQDKGDFLRQKYMIKMNLSDSEEYKNNNILRENEMIYSTDDIEYKKRITNIMAKKNNMHVKVNPRVYLKSAVTIRELNEKRNVKEKMKNLYKPLNNIIHREYNCLFNWIDYNKKLSRSYKKSGNEESENKNINTNYDDYKRRESEFGDSKKLSFSSDIPEDKDDKNEKAPFKISNKKVRFSENI
jgi:CRP-like cAMP-binding protein